MTLETELHTRADAKCELCQSAEDLAVFAVPPHPDDTPNHCLLICQTCITQIDTPDKVNVHHWHCLNDSMWSQTPAVQVMAWRMLSRLRTESWAQDLLDTLYLDDEVLAWAKSTEDTADGESTVVHKDSNGAVLAIGDAVTLIKDLNVKGAGFTAKRGIVVRRISLVPDNPGQIEGRVNGQQIVILTEFVKKSN